MKHALVAACAVLALAACKPAAETTEPGRAAPAAPTGTAAPVAYFYFGNHVPRAVITSVEGADTASAILTGHVTAQDNYDYCLDMRGGETPSAGAIAECTAEKVDQPDERMTADCIARTVSDGSDALWVRDEEAEDGKVMPVWQDRASGDIRDYSGAGGGYVLTAAFRILCPAASANVAPDPS
ncbi:hypothetical protein [Brevundimonas sp.]|uniref:hypothetical protein n=1 Tax=Brevundimonas sp. TaxID=1871086 RepID=UPI003D0B2D6A